MKHKSTTKFAKKSAIDLTFFDSCDSCLRVGPDDLRLQRLRTLERKGYVQSNKADGNKIAFALTGSGKFALQGLQLQRDIGAL
jgi:hypothetical protein